MKFEIPVGEVKVNQVFKHPTEDILLRRVQPKDSTCVVIAPVNEAIFAVDDEGNFYTFAGCQVVSVPHCTPLVTEKSSDNYIIMVSFERQLSDDLPTIEENFARNAIGASPNHNFPLAAMRQLSLELEPAYEDGMAGFFQCHYVLPNRAFNTKAMGWKHRKGNRG